MAVGLEGAKASEIVERFDRERIERQIEALPSRKIKSSRTGFLIRAIELDIPVESAQAPVTEASRLAEHFYAELGGNSGEPVGFVSSADEEAAQSLVKKLPKVLSAKPDRAGRELARFVLRQSEKSKFPVRSLPLAIRTYGDEFLASSQLRAEREERETLAARKTRIRSSSSRFTARNFGQRPSSLNPKGENAGSNAPHGSSPERSADAACPRRSTAGSWSNGKASTAGPRSSLSFSLKPSPRQYHPSGSGTPQPTQPHFPRKEQTYEQHHFGHQSQRRRREDDDSGQSSRRNGSPRLQSPSGRP